MSIETVSVTQNIETEIDRLVDERSRWKIHQAWQALTGIKSAHIILAEGWWRDWFGSNFEWSLPELKKTGSITMASVGTKRLPFYQLEKPASYRALKADMVIFADSQRGFGSVAIAGFNYDLVLNTEEDLQEKLVFYHFGQNINVPLTPSTKRLENLGKLLSFAKVL